MKFSVIVPVYNRPDEMVEFLDSLAAQEDCDFEVMVMEAPSEHTCQQLCASYEGRLNITHILKDSSRSDRRNEGMRLASGDYFMLFDSDCILPPNYIKVVREALEANYCDCYGGPDSANASFSDLQLAVNYAMTSIMTTGGIRGGMKNVNNYLPRAFNMGLSKMVFETVGGYREMIGEDVDLSMRIKEAGFSVRLIPEAVVVHKRRLTLKKFYKQVNTFGKARVLLSKVHPHSLKLMHLFPTCFALGNILLILISIITLSWLWILPLIVYIIALFVESLCRNRSVKVALLSIVCSYIQMFGYGLGFIEELITGKASKQSAEQLYRQ